SLCRFTQPRVSCANFSGEGVYSGWSSKILVSMLNSNLTLDEVFALSSRGKFEFNIETKISESQLRKLFRRRRVLRMVLEDLGLDVEFELAARTEREHLIEGRNRRAGNRRLFRKMGIPQRAAIPLA